MKKAVLIIIIICTAFQVYAQPRNIKHVILIGCDGLGAYAIPKSNMPHLKKLMDTGSWSLTARSVLPSSSAVNWASMLMGVGPTMHGYTEWGSKVPEIPSVTKTKYDLFPGIFSLIKDQKPKAKTAVIYSWGGIGYLFEKKAVDFVVPGPEHDTENFCADTAASIVKNEKPLLTFIHFSEPDGVGHNIGHNTPQYYEELVRLDQRIGKIVKAVNDAGMEKETVFIVSSDHGGTGKGHGGKTLDEVQIPWIIKGAGIKKGHQIEDVIITYDTASTIAWLLGLKIPQSWRGQAVMEAFR